MAHAALVRCADRDGHCCRQRLTGQRGEFLDEMVSLGVLDEAGVDGGSTARYAEDGNWL
jgi:hypothetical protein